MTLRQANKPIHLSERFSYLCTGIIRSTSQGLGEADILIKASYLVFTRGRVGGTGMRLGKSHRAPCTQKAQHLGFNALWSLS